MQPYNNPIFTPIKNNNFDILSSNKQKNLSSSSGIIWGKIDEFSNNNKNNNSILYNCQLNNQSSKGRKLIEIFNKYSFNNKNNENNENEENNTRATKLCTGKHYLPRASSTRKRLTVFSDFLASSLIRSTSSGRAEIEIVLYSTVRPLTVPTGRPAPSLFPPLGIITTPCVLRILESMQL